MRRAVGTLAALILLLPGPGLAFAYPVKNLYELEKLVEACQANDLLTWLENGFDPNLAGQGDMLDSAIGCELPAAPGPRDDPDPCRRKDDVSLNLVSMLLEFGANPQLPDNGDHNPLMVAITTACNWGSVHALLNAGANPNLVAYDGRTALIVSLDQPDNGFNPGWLIEGGADVEAHDTKGLTPLQHFLANPKTCTEDQAVDADALKSSNDEKMKGLIFGKADIARKTPPDFVSPTDATFSGAHDAVELLAARIAEPNLSADQQACFNAVKGELDYRIKFPLH